MGVVFEAGRSSGGWRLEEEELVGKDVCFFFFFRSFFCGDFFGVGLVWFGGIRIVFLVNQSSVLNSGVHFFFLVSDFWLDDRFHGISSVCQKKGFRKVGVVESLFFVVTQRIHVWYIYLHSVDFYGKCR